MRATWALAVVAVLALVTGEPATAAPAPEPTEPERVVTLITGDRVQVGRDGITMRPAPAKGREHIRFALNRFDGHSYVIPRDAVPMLASGALDRRLFDVTGLLDLGYDDAHRADLPLIVRGGQSAGLTTQRLSTLDLRAVSAAKGPEFWGQVVKDPKAKVWLDGVRHPLLDRSVPHIGAPAAWAAGYTGTGVTVAVLDSGIDASHPDLAGRVVDARNFTAETDRADAVGHGTHVASTIAGSGAASGGRYRGVAPDASLLDGKVCGQFECTESAILAGMEWASVEKGAAVVNVSLGGPDLPGLDPLEEAVNRLTATQGTLFVIAAGNYGQCSTGNRVGSPGSAEAALTVGAMDLADKLASFSCQGPTIDGNALKPDISAPGVDIVAARVPGTPDGDADPVDEHYARLSGTSMATPHVAGAAALLAQRHPDWRADRLKAGLMGSTVVSAGLTPYQQGAGRVDVARAIGQSVIATPASLSLGVQRWPHTDDVPSVSTLTYHNSGDNDVVLSVRADVTGPTGQPVPAGVVVLSATTLTVPAGGDASVTVTVDTRAAGTSGRFSGWIRASAGAVSVGTPLGVEHEPESYDLTVRGIDRAGAATDIMIGDIFTPDRILFFQGGTGVRLPKGTYELVAFIFTPDIPDSAGSLSLLSTSLNLTTNATVTFDARRAKAVEVVSPRAGAGMPTGMIALTGFESGTSFTFGLFAGESFHGLYSGHFGRSANPHRMSAYVYTSFADPGPNGDYSYGAYVYNLAWFSPGRGFDGFFRQPRDRELANVKAEFVSPEGRIATKVDFARLPGVPEVSTVGTQYQFLVPGTRMEYYTTESAQWRGELAVYGPFGQEAVQNTNWRAYRKGNQTERWGGSVLGPSLSAPHTGDPWVRQTPNVLFFDVPMFSDSTPGHTGYMVTDTAFTYLYRDGVLVAGATQPGSIAYEAPSASAAIRVDTWLTQSRQNTSTEIRASWQFRTRPVTSVEGEALSLMTVRFRPDVDTSNSAPGGRPYLVPVSIERQPGTPASRIVSLTVDVSYDAGVTWQSAPLLPTGHGWVAALRHPTSGSVSFRTKAVDASGSSVEETIIRAYQLR